MDEVCAAARALRTTHRHVFAQGLHPADQALPGRLPLLHVRASARARPAGVPHREEVLAVARAGAAAGCHEALFTAGTKPELRYRVARDELAALGCSTTLRYGPMRGSCRGTGLLPHLNPGVMMTRDDLAALRQVSVSQGIMLGETASERLSARGRPHFGSPDKLPAARLATIDAAGRERVPFTTGILIGIGEGEPERIEPCSRSASCTSATATSRK